MAKSPFDAANYAFGATTALQQGQISFSNALNAQTAAFNQDLAKVLAAKSKNQIDGVLMQEAYKTLADSVGRLQAGLDALRDIKPK